MADPWSPQQKKLAVTEWQKIRDENGRFVDELPYFRDKTLIEPFPKLQEQVTNAIKDMAADEIETFCPTGRKQWRQWLQKNHAKKNAVWLIYYKKKTNKTSLTWSDAVDEALCFGWIDSKRKAIDDEKFMQFFGKRKAKSAWSKINKQKVERLISEGLMTKAGLDCIETAKQNGSWTLLDQVEELVIPSDLGTRLKKKPGACKFFSGLSRSDKRAILQWVALARRPETREKRIAEVVACASKNLKPKQFQV